MFQMFNIAARLNDHDKSLEIRGKIFTRDSLLEIESSISTHIRAIRRNLEGSRIAWSVVLTTMVSFIEGISVNDELRMNSLH